MKQAILLILLTLILVSACNLIKPKSCEDELVFDIERKINTEQQAISSFKYFFSKDDNYNNFDESKLEITDQSYNYDNLVLDKDGKITKKANC